MPLCNDYTISASTLAIGSAILAGIGIKTLRGSYVTTKALSIDSIKLLAEAGVNFYRLGSVNSIELDVIENTTDANVVFHDFSTCQLKESFETLSVECKKHQLRGYAKYYSSDDLSDQSILCQFDNKYRVKEYTNHGWLKAPHDDPKKCFLIFLAAHAEVFYTI